VFVVFWGTLDLARGFLNSSFIPKRELGFWEETHILGKGIFGGFIYTGFKPPFFEAREG